MNFPTRLCAVVLAAAMGVSPVLAQSTGKSNSINNASITMTTSMGSFPLLAWSWGASNSGSVTQNPGGGGMGGGRTNIQDLSISRYVDGQSVAFFKMLATGRFIDEVTLERGGVKIKFEDVLVTSISTGGSASERTEALTENISLNFGVIRMMIDREAYCYNVVEQRSC